MCVVRVRVRVRVCVRVRVAPVLVLVQQLGHATHPVDLSKWYDDIGDLREAVAT